MHHRAMSCVPDGLVRHATFREVVEFGSASIDLDRSGVGGAPQLGDISSSGVAVPKEPTPSQVCRYLIRLCGVEAGPGCNLVLRGIRTAITLRGDEVNSDGVPTGLVLKHHVESPFWTFYDGGVTLHLRWQQQVFAPLHCDPMQVAGTSPNARGLDSALLYDRRFPYVPLNAGLPYGVAVGDFGTWRDLRFPYTNNCWIESDFLVGPGALVLYASVHQTDPATRQDPESVKPGMLPEDQFITSFKNARYDRVAGSILVEFLPCGTKECP